MANTYTLIASNTLSTSASFVTFSSIPQTYTDLLVRYSHRSTHASVTVNGQLYINNVTSGTKYSSTSLSGDGSAASSTRESNTNKIYYPTGTGSSATSNTFGSGEVYIPNYTASQNRVVSGFGVSETDATAAQIEIRAQLYRDTTAVTRLDFYLNFGDLASGSSFFLYGIKNS